MLYVNEPEPIEISLRFLPIYPKAGVYYGIVTPSLLINEIERKTNLLGKVVSVSPDTIYLSFEPEKSKKVPVKAEFDLTFEKQFMRYGKSVFTPDCVTVRGPDRIIENLDSISLGQIKLEQLNDSYTGEKIFERDSLSQSLSFTPEEVHFTIPVEKFTETEIDIPVKVINTNGLNIRLFPDKVKVIYTVALKDFDKIESAMILAYVDLSRVNIAEDDKIKVDLESYPSYINIHRIEPEKVEFIIIK
jgi:YbbR domain-containing protein